VDYLGLDAADADAVAARAGLATRVVAADGVERVITMELRPDRLDLMVFDGVVVAALLPDEPPVTDPPSLPPGGGEAPGGGGSSTVPEVSIGGGAPSGGDGSAGVSGATPRPRS
jgi:hypothetical protein